MSDAMEEPRGYLDDGSYWVQSVGHGPSGKLTDMTALLVRSANHRLEASDEIVVILKDEQDYIFASARVQQPGS
jgi:hypothetical protein